MNSEKLYVWLQAYCIYFNIVSICTYTYYMDKMYKGEHPVLYDVFSSIFSLVWQIGSYFLIKLLVSLLIIIFNFNIDHDYRLKVTLVIFTELTINDVFLCLHKIAKERS